MPLKRLTKIGLAAAVILIIMLIYHTHTHHRKGIREEAEEAQRNHRIGDVVLSRSQAERIHLVVVICYDRSEEAFVLLKSAILMTTSAQPLVIHIVAEKELHLFLKSQLESLPADVLERVEYKIYKVSFPEDEIEIEWKKLFKPCASQRLFLPSLLADVDAVIYVDTDTLFFAPLEKLWGFFSNFSARQLVALTPDHEDPELGHYNRFAHHPFVMPLGVNSGVMLMNLTRMRKSSWESSMIRHYATFDDQLAYGDQDLINIYLYFKRETVELCTMFSQVDSGTVRHVQSSRVAAPAVTVQSDSGSAGSVTVVADELYTLPCEWNYRQCHCANRSICKSAEKNGIHILHGSSRSMQDNKEPAFAAVYIAFRDFHIGEDVAYGLLNRMMMNLQPTMTTNCGRNISVFFQQLETTWGRRSDTLQ